MQKDLESLESKKVQVVGISYDPVELLANFAQQRQITFPLLSDSGSATIKAFGLLNSEAKGRIEGIPHPGVVILDKQGAVRAKLFHEGYRDRHTAGEILEALP